MECKQLWFMALLLVSAWQDFRTRSVSSRVYLIFGSVGIWFCIKECKNRNDLVISCGIGAFLLLLSYLTNGGIGEGDGWFFVISGLYLKWKYNAFLLLGGLFCCCLGSLLLIVRTIVRNQKGRTESLPFLPFLLPAGIWLLSL